jgi:hypothetical protein
MSKKTKKRQSRKKRSTSSSAKSTAPAGNAQVKVETGFHPDYSETIKDLKRIGVLAGTFFIILLGLSFFLN